MSLRLAYSAPAEPERLSDKSAFEEAVTRKDAHSWLSRLISTQNLGYFNVVSLHEALINRDVSRQPYLVSDPITALRLAAFEPDVKDVKAALEDTAFYNALLRVAKRRKTPLPAAYREAIDSNEAYAAIFKQELAGIDYWR